MVQKKVLDGLWGTKKSKILTKIKVVDGTMRFWAFFVEENF